MVLKTQGFSLKGRAKSIAFAGRGVILMIKSQHNAWIHLVATLVVVFASLIFELSKIELSIVVLTIMTVWVAEALNTAFEFLCDVVSPEFHPLVEKSKDIAAGAVLISSICAIIVGGIIFFPYLSNF